MSAGASLQAELEGRRCLEAVSSSTACQKLQAPTQATTAGGEDAPSPNCLAALQGDDNHLHMHTVAVDKGQCKEHSLKKEICRNDKAMTKLARREKALQHKLAKEQRSLQDSQQKLRKAEKRLEDARSELGATRGLRSAAGTVSMAGAVASSALGVGLGAVVNVFLPTSVEAMEGREEERARRAEKEANYRTAAVSKRESARNAAKQHLDALQEEIQAYKVTSALQSLRDPPGMCREETGRFSRRGSLLGIFRRSSSRKRVRVVNEARSQACAEHQQQ